MADKPKGPAIPSWQLPKNNAASDTTTAAAPANNIEKTEASTKESLIEQASRFLEDESIRDAPTDKKIAFLESKGLQNDDIHKLLGISRNPEATGADAKSSATDSSKSLAPNTQTSQPSTSAMASSSSPATPNSTSTSTSASTPASPPIITYPEFLLQAQKPPPLVTFQGVMYTLYGAAGLAATIYGASQYLVKPMLGELSRARHELAETAERNLKTLNEKLEKNVSSIPPVRQHPSPDEQQADDDSDSITSDPTELFHRDIATQTSPELEQPPTPAIVDPETDGLSSSETTVNTHVKRLQSISSQLTDFLSDQDESGSVNNSTEDRLSELKNYLDGLIYSSPSPYMGSNLYGIYNDNSSPMGGGKAGSANKEEDAIAAFKTEIRSVKGTLLSARNFPAGGGIRSSIPSPGGR
ncbi:hypothetical protein AJ79_04059 [Helicocarpus griseus UAMH5409]|uniref:Peroxisomal membrane protein PEX14 n=1 Tax=Helicocarpus griseus UAMH5409 TaxID=1447875 RepID=A0A2B7XV61_9EURO|nr:hypothetical protein AJ79_04059 [Helicocarpus griseus UAMH5409]